LALKVGNEEIALLEDDELTTSEPELDAPPQAVRMIKIDINSGDRDFFILLNYTKIPRKPMRKIKVRLSYA
jgi:hypothetical protein